MVTTGVRSDAAIQKAVLLELAWDTRVEETDIGVEVDRGIVTLTGTVSSFAKRLAAAEAAHRVWGVRDVANDITVKIPGMGAPTDTEIAQAVRQAFRWDPLIREEDIETTVSAGWVTLQGRVATWREREDAEHAIRHLMGVRGVSNLITVSAPPVAPADVRLAIEDALERRAERTADRVSIAVQDGTVTLTGHVHSWQERLAVVGAAGHAPGVRAVSDQLRIEPLG